MSDYSFMQSGLGGEYNPQFNLQDLEVMLAHFIKNSLKAAAKYVKICKRNGITKLDMEYALKYEVFEFFNSPNLAEELIELKQTYFNEIECVCDCNCDCGNEDPEECTCVCNCECECDDCCNAEDEIFDNVVKDNIINPFSRISINDVETEDKEFVNNFHRHFDSYNEWQPQSPIELALQNAINKINSQ